MRDYYTTNDAYREATRTRAAAWLAENPDRARETTRAYAKAHAARLKEAARSLYLEKREERIAYSVAWAKANPERVREAKRRWKQRNPDNTLLHVNRRRFRKAAATIVPFTLGALGQRLSMFPGCWVCGGEPNEVDHVKPLAKGGPHCLANLRPICSSCNRSKHDRWPVEVAVD